MSKNKRGNGNNRNNGNSRTQTPASVTPASTVVQTNSNNKVQENKMTNSNPSIADLFEANKAVATASIKNGTAGLGEFRKLMKKINAEKKVVRVNTKDLLKQAKENKILKLQIKQHAELLLLEIDAKYEEDMKVFEQYTIENAEQVAVVVVEKTTKYVAPITRGASEGIRSIGKNLFGFSLNK